MTAVSAVLIVKNEEDCLGQCLASLQGLDEIIVLDTGSTDSTCDLARSYGATVFEGVYTWEDDFAKARNAAQRYATKNWIFVIDADETLEVGGVQKIRDAVQRLDLEGLDVGSVWIESTNSRHHQPRLYRGPRPDIVWVGSVHNYLSKLGQLDTGVVILAGYSPTHAKDQDRALRMLLAAVERDPKSPRYLYYLGREWGYKRQWAKAEETLRECLKYSKWIPERADAWLLLARALWNQRKGLDARLACIQAIGLNPNFKEALLLMGDMSFEKEKARWHSFAQLATSEGVLFARVK